MSQIGKIRKFYAIVIMVISLVYGLAYIADMRTGVPVRPIDGMFIAACAAFGAMLYLSQVKINK